MHTKISQLHTFSYRNIPVAYHKMYHAYQFIDHVFHVVVTYLIYSASISLQALPPPHLDKCNYLVIHT